MNINISLNDEKSIDNAISQLRKYSTDLVIKTNRLCELLAEKGIAIAEMSAQGDTHHFDEMVVFTKEWQGKMLCLVGKNGATHLHTEWYDANGVYHTETISPILALEFGTAGLRIEAGQPSMAVTGSHAHSTQWMYYSDIDENGNPIGLKYATAEEPHRPMYNAWLQMKSEVMATAKEVFG